VFGVGGGCEMWWGGGGGEEDGGGGGGGGREKVIGREGEREKGVFGSSLWITPCFL